MRDIFTPEFMALMDRLTTIGMQVPFCVIMAAARSKRHLQVLHNDLPPNLQLTLGDFLVLQKAWGKSATDDKRQLTPAAMEAIQTIVMKQNQFRHRNLTSYYAGIIDDRRKEMGEMTENHALVLSHEARNGHGSEHFVAFMLGDEKSARLEKKHPFMLGCRFYGDTLVVRITTHSSDLTEELTHQIFMSKLMNSEKIYTGLYGRRYDSNGMEVDFHFTIPYAGDIKALTFAPNIKTHPHLRERRLINDMGAFVAKLHHRINEWLELGIFALYPIVPSDKNSEARMIPGTEFKEGVSGTTDWCLVDTTEQ